MTFLDRVFAGLLRAPRGDEGQQLCVHDPGLRRRGPHGRHGRRRRRPQEEEQQAPAPPGNQPHSVAAEVIDRLECEQMDNSGATERWNYCFEI